MELTDYEAYIKYLGFSVHPGRFAIHSDLIGKTAAYVIEYIKFRGIHFERLYYNGIKICGGIDMYRQGLSIDFVGPKVIVTSQEHVPGNATVKLVY